LTLAATGAVTFTSVPTARAFAGKCVDACVAQANTWLGTEQIAGGDRVAAPDTASLGLAGLRGQVVLVNFWAPWCRPCVVEMPWFDEMQQAFGQSGFAVVGVSVEPGASAKGKVKYRLIDDADETLARAYQVEALPATFVIDRNGKIAFRHSGLVSKEVYEREVKSLLLR
jgi:peroxiredoxin